MGISVRLLACSSWVVCFAAQATCSFPEQGSRVFYGGQREASTRSSALVCFQPSKPNLMRKPKAPEKDAGMHEMRLDAMDKAGVALILSRELSNTEAELAQARQQEGGDAQLKKDRIHRLEGDVAALRSELSRVQKR